MSSSDPGITPMSLMSPALAGGCFFFFFLPLNHLGSPSPDCYKPLFSRVLENMKLTILTVFSLIFFWGSSQHCLCQERTSQLEGVPFARKERGRWVTSFSSFSWHCVKVLLWFRTIQTSKAEMYTADWEQRRKAEAVISRHAVGLIKLHRDLLFRQNSEDFIIDEASGQHSCCGPLIDLTSFLLTGIHVP